MPNHARGGLGLVAALAIVAEAAVGQSGSSSAVGQYYSVRPPLPAERFFDAILIERVAPHSLAMPPPVEPMRVGVTLSALTGQILELPERQRLYLTAADARGALRLLEIDLLRREIREVLPQPGTSRSYAAHMLAAPDGSKLYVQWFAPGIVPSTDIYDGTTLHWLGQTSGFRPDERAVGFEHEPPYLWTLDLANQPVLVDAHRDRVVRTFDLRRSFEPSYAVIADAWRDLLLARLEVGHDRYHVVDTVSGEVGPALQLDGYRHAQPRLALDGRLLVLIDMERRPPSRARRWSQTATATGTGAVFDLRSGQQAETFRLVMPFEFPVTAVGTTDDPRLPGRLWIHVPGDEERLDFSLPACGPKAPAGDDLTANVDVRWDDDDPYMYRYRVTVDASSARAVGALAIRAGRETGKTSAPDGWGVDRLKGDRWVRWMNGLGPATEDIAPGDGRSGFVIAAERTRPGIGEYRIQAALGLPRGCESDNRFLENSSRGSTVVPESVEATAPRDLAERLATLVRRACEIGWIERDDCSRLEMSAALVRADGDRAGAVEQFLTALAASRQVDDKATLVLTDAASAVLHAQSTLGRD